MLQYLPDEIELSDWTRDSDAFGDIGDDLFSVTICDLTWFPNQGPVLQVTAGDFLENQNVTI